MKVKLIVVTLCCLLLLVDANPYISYQTSETTTPQQSIFDPIFSTRCEMKVCPEGEESHPETCECVGVVSLR